MTYHDCQTCTAYFVRRKSVVVPAMVETLAKTGETSQQILDRYMAGVHERHMAGGSL